MNRHPRYGRIAASSLAILTLFGIGSAYAQGRPPTAPQNSFAEIIDRLTRIEAQLNAPSASATFCISQGRGLDLKGKYAVEAATELDLGAGWPNVAWAKATGKANIPLVLFAPPLFIPIPIPNEVSLELGGGHGRNFDICVELPVALSPGDQQQLQAVWATMNDPANLGETFQAKGKFQRRAARAINYACRKVGGVLQCPILPNVLAVSGQVNAADTDQVFERADIASENLLEGGFGAVEEGLQAFSDGNVSELVASLELPSDIRSALGDPERIFEGLPDLSRGLPSCDSLQITPGMRARRPVLSALCAELSGLPNDGVVKGAFDKIDQLSDEVLDAIAEVLRPLLTNVGESSQSTRTRFCNSAIGQRPVFDRYCGR